MTARSQNRTLPTRLTILAAIGVTSLALVGASPANAIYYSYDSDSEAPTWQRTAEQDNPPTEEPKQGCNLKLPNGGIDPYKHGDTVTITVKGSDGSSYTMKFRCNDGKWEPASLEPQTGDFHFDADDAYVDESGGLVLVNPYEEYVYSTDAGFYAEP